MLAIDRGHIYASDIRASTLLGAGALDVVLDDLERDGFIVGSWDSLLHPISRRRFYSLTDAGRREIAR